MEIGGLFMAIGHKPNTEHLIGSGISIDPSGYIKVEKNCYTNIKVRILLPAARSYSSSHYFIRAFSRVGMYMIKLIDKL